MRINFASMAVWAVAALSICNTGMAAGAHDGFNGVWQVAGTTTTLLTSDGKQPPLLPAAKAVYEKNRQSRKLGDLKFDSTTQCEPPGVPRLAYVQMPFEIMVQAKKVFLMYQWNRLVRIVDLDKQHFEPLGPTFLGQSVAYWEGDALIIDTNGFNDTTLLDAAGMPHSDQLHVVERYALSKNGQRLDVIITIEDAQTFSMPWETKVSFMRLRNTRIAEDVCVERLQLEQYK